MILNCSKCSASLLGTQQCKLQVHNKQMVVRVGHCAASHSFECRNAPASNCAGPCIDANAAVTRHATSSRCLDGCLVLCLAACLAAPHQKYHTITKNLALVSTAGRVVIGLYGDDVPKTAEVGIAAGSGSTRHQQAAAFAASVPRPAGCSYSDKQGGPYSRHLQGRQQHQQQQPLGLDASLVRDVGPIRAAAATAVMGAAGWQGDAP